MLLEAFSLGEKDGLTLILKAAKQKHLPKFNHNLNTDPEERDSPKSLWNKILKPPISFNIGINLSFPLIKVTVVLYNTEHVLMMCND